MSCYKCFFLLLRVIKLTPPKQFNLIQIIFKLLMLKLLFFFLLKSYPKYFKLVNNENPTEI